METKTYAMSEEDVLNTVPESFAAFLDMFDIDKDTEIDKSMVEEYELGHRQIRRSSDIHGYTEKQAVTTSLIWLHWLARHPGAMLVITSPSVMLTRYNYVYSLRDVLKLACPEIQKLFKVSEQGVHVAGRKRHEWGAMVVASCRPENFEGIHREHLGFHLHCNEEIKHTIQTTIRGTLSYHDLEKTLVIEN